MDIFRIQCKKNSYTLTPEAEEEALQFFTELYEERTENFGNGRDVRNCFEDMVVRQSNRVAAMENPSKEDLVTVLPEDLRDPEENAESENPAADPNTAASDETSEVTETSGKPEDED